MSLHTLQTILTRFTSTAFRSSKKARLMQTTQSKHRYDNLSQIHSRWPHLFGSRCAKRDSTELRRNIETIVLRITWHVSRRWKLVHLRAWDGASARKSALMTIIRPCVILSSIGAILCPTIVLGSWTPLRLHLFTDYMRQWQVEDLPYIRLRLPHCRLDRRRYPCSENKRIPR